MKNVYHDILALIDKGGQGLAILIDPDKTDPESIPAFIRKIDTCRTTHIFVGGSHVDMDTTDIIVKEIKKATRLPVVLFPGDITQITDRADALLFLSLISGRNPDYLIGKHVESVSRLRHTNLEIIPTGYILIENGKKTAVEQVTATLPMPRHDIQKVVDTALAGQLLGLRMIYLEAGSGATEPVDAEMIGKVKEALDIPVLVGGGIRKRDQLEDAYKAGADMVVIGTALEEDESFINQLN
jgi:putative glycerol-1-phosphate prenyltransferase